MTIASMNVCALRTFEMRDKIAKYTNDQTIDITCIQGTHVGTDGLVGKNEYNML